MQSKNIDYFVSFHAGSQGRFVDLAIKALLQNSFGDFKFCRGEFNSWHYDFRSRGYQNNTFQDYRAKTSEEFYSLVQFSSNKINSVQTHMYPHWPAIAKRSDLDHVKFVVIKISESDLLEIHGNIIYKNYLRDLMIGNPSPGTKNRLDNIYNIFCQLYGAADYDTAVKELTTDHSKAQQIIEVSFQDPLWDISDKFINIAVNDEFVDKTLVIDYRDIFTKSAKSYIALDKICDFFKVRPEQPAVEMFLFNQQGRSAMIDEYMYNLNIR